MLNDLKWRRLDQRRIDSWIMMINKVAYDPGSIPNVREHENHTKVMVGWCGYVDRSQFLSPRAELHKHITPRAELRKQNFRQRCSQRSFPLEQKRNFAISHRAEVWKRNFTNINYT